jgi:hypothetical protein
MKPLLLGAGLAIPLGSASFAEPAAPQTMKIDAQGLSAASKKSTAARTRREPGKIACTVAGCHEIPPAAVLKWVTTGTGSPPASTLWSARPTAAAAAKSGMNIEPTSGAKSVRTS